LKQSSFKKLIFLFFLSITVSCVSTSDQKESLDKAEAFLIRGQFREAIASYKKLLLQNPENKEARLKLASAFYKSGDYAKAKKQLDFIQDKEKSFEANYLLSQIYRMNAEYKQTVYFLNQALKIKKNDPLSLRDLAWTYSKLKNYNKAIQVATLAKTLSPNDEGITIVLIKALLSSKDFSKVEPLLIKQQWSEESKATVDTLWGDFWFQTEQFEKATVSYKKALKQNALLGSALIGLARCFEKEGNHEKAEKFYKRAIHVLPKDTDLREQFTEFKKKTDSKTKDFRAADL
jgi:tetratricopeptide (TPR) repeat protein